MRKSEIVMKRAVLEQREQTEDKGEIYSIIPPCSLISLIFLVFPCLL
jgi:hypothetical protein